MQNQDPEILAEKKKLQMEIILKESDVRKTERDKMTIETELRDLKYKITLLQSEVVSKETFFKKIEEEHMLLQNEVIKLKHKMNSLGKSQSY